jgi:hypothetical protein
MIDEQTVVPLLAGTSSLIALRHHHVIVELPKGLPTAERGRRLLSLERTLREGVDPKAEVFLEPRQDANKLRQRLRGVTL